MTTILTQTVARLLLLPALVIAKGVLAKGYTSVGDGFSAGVIAALAILLLYLAFGYREVERYLPVRGAPVLVFVGLLLALLVGFGPVVAGYTPVTHFPPPGADVIRLGVLDLHTAVLFDIGVYLLVIGFGVTTLRHLARLAAEREA